MNTLVRLVALMLVYALVGLQAGRAATPGAIVDPGTAAQASVAHEPSSRAAIPEPEGRPGGRSTSSSNTASTPKVALGSGSALGGAAGAGKAAHSAARGGTMPQRGSPGLVRPASGLSTQNRGAKQADRGNAAALQAVMRAPARGGQLLQRPSRGQRVIRPTSTVAKGAMQASHALTRAPVSVSNAPGNGLLTNRQRPPALAALGGVPATRTLGTATLGGKALHRRF